MTTEQRVDRLEEVAATMGELLFATRDMVLETRDMVVETRDMVVETRNIAERTLDMVEEMRRENRQTRRIWIAIARKQELFDDDEFQDLFGDEE